MTEPLPDNLLIDETSPAPLKFLQISTVDLTPYCFFRNWFRYLGDEGYQVTLATTVVQFRQELEATGAVVVHIPMARGINPVMDFISLVRLWRFMKKEKFHMVQTYTTKAGFIGRLAARLAGVPVIFHNILEPPHNSTKNPLLRAFYIWMERLAGTWAHHLFTTTSPNLREILDKKLAPPDKITAIPEGLMLEKYDRVRVNPEEKRRELGISPDDVFILTVARLETPKGHTYLMEASAKLLRKRQDLHFICVGKGNLRQQLEHKAEALGIANRFRYMGFRYDHLEIIRSCDLFVLPSLWEGQGVAIMEAMALKKPVVACKVGGVVDVIDEGVTGLMVPPRDPGALAEAIEEILTDTRKMEEMGRAGYARIRDSFDEAKFNETRLKKVREVYQRVTEKR